MCIRIGAMLTIMLLVGGCASSSKSSRPPAGSFDGKLSEQILPASIISPEWIMEQGLVIDDLSNPPEIVANRRAWAETFIRQRRAAGAQSYAEIFYFSPERPPVKVSTLVLVYIDVKHARAHWNSIYGPGMMTLGYRRTNRFGDKTVEHKKYDDIVVLAGNTIIQVTQPVQGEANEIVLKAYLSRLGLDQPATQPVQ